ncbi:MAG: arsenate reductase family protein [Elusimicrobia bacterium]|nr:arsenate reductase family protein [Elusimicrobiota bacterium]
MAIKIYSYSGCGTCRNALKWLAARKAEAVIMPIRETPPTLPELKRMLGIYQGQLRKLFNTSGVDYKALKMKDKLPTMKEPEALALLSKNGNLVKRPFLLTGSGGAVGFIEADWDRLVPRR